MTTSHIGARIKERRRALGLSQKQLGKVVGVTYANISHWEQGVNNPRPNKLQRLSNALDTTIEYLLNGAGELWAERRIKRFSDRLRAARVLNCLTQDELAEKVGVTSACVSQWELGIVKPRPNKLDAISVALDVSVDWLKNGGLPIGTPATRTREELETLKHDWNSDPCWDIEDTEGFEAHYDELKAYHEKCKAEWEKRNTLDDEKLEEELKNLGPLGLFKMVQTLKSRLAAAEERICRLENPNG